MRWKRRTLWTTGSPTGSPGAYAGAAGRAGFPRWPTPSAENRSVHPARGDPAGSAGIGRHERCPAPRGPGSGPGPGGSEDVLPVREGRVCGGGGPLTGSSGEPPSARGGACVAAPGGRDRNRARSREERSRTREWGRCVSWPDLTPTGPGRIFFMLMPMICLRPRARHR